MITTPSCESTSQHRHQRPPLRRYPELLEKQNTPRKIRKESLASFYDITPCAGFLVGFSARALPESLLSKALQRGHDAGCRRYPAYWGLKVVTRTVGAGGSQLRWL